jgi:hypothetical protein
MEQNATTEQPDEPVYGPPMPGDTGTAKIGPLVIAPRLSIWLIYLAVILVNVILIGAIVLIALNRADKL